MAEIILNQACINALFRKRITAGVAQHMRVYRNGNAGLHAIISHHNVNVLSGKRSAFSRQEQLGKIGV
ncbi:hypothetical protein AZ036_003096 [Klebsiella michiganensis]|uniref:Uncharacterized protein n=1 Tax=Klebsiella michiganensis TaxID=1134687 RepID=A0ABR5GG89_9ENTR|nr:hypothetical protein L387_03032 [Klebsiella michiganensis]KLY37455.1 hypothetical protein SK91_02223 [Klebsiella michiganensis]OUG47321.1 hypothetical protein AZ036_003096 [Klebsiella michiganensis]